jgi:glucose-6-phosphate isomerase
MIQYSVGKFEQDVNNTFNRLLQEDVINRIWKKDHTLWSDDPNEITNRLAWLNSPAATKNSIKDITDFVEAVKKDGFTNALLLGMGGSSLAPEVFRLTFGVEEGFLDLSVLDSTDPGAAKHFADKLNPEKTLYIVSTKSGGTVETFSFMKFFFNNVSEKIGKEKAGNHFIAITDPGSGLQKVAEVLRFRKIFLNDPDIGGRFSALSLFGCVPAALIGVDLPKFLERAESAAEQASFSDEKNIGARLGCIIGELAEQSVDKLTFIISDKIKSFGSWVEQLIAESTGKNGKGILPVDGEELLTPEYYANDRLFVSIKLKGENLFEDKIDALKATGYPVIEIVWNDLYDLASEFYVWEFATAVAGWKMQVQPFDQPNVEQAKVIAREFIKNYMEAGALPEMIPELVENDIKVYGETSARNIKDAFNNFVDQTQAGKSYVSIQAYLKPDKETDVNLQRLRTDIQKKYKVPVTVGYGPRFLHSTGQLHKGDAGNGLFIQLLADMPDDLPIPDNPGEDKSSITFGVLKTAQAFGDRQALIDNKRKVLTIDIGRNKIEMIQI